MTSRAEARFSYIKTVESLRQFLLEKKRKINTEVSSKAICENNIARAKGFINLIEELLKSEYFVGRNLHIKVFQLMDSLKKEDVVFKTKIGLLEQKIENMESYLEVSDEFKINTDFSIPDEQEAQAAAIIAKRQEYKWKIEAVREELNGYKYRLKLCRDLKGIICRPNGFFSSIYK